MNLSYTSAAHRQSGGAASLIRHVFLKSVSRMNYLLVLFTLLTATVSASDLPDGFAESRLATGLDPTGIEVAPDGRVFITEKSGKVRIIKNGSLLTTPFLSITVDNNNERGLQSIVFDPNFASNKYVYVYYTVRGNGSTPAHNRVSRFTANGDVAVARSEDIIFELDNLSSAGNHNGGALLFKDGKLYIFTGENADPNKSQSMSTVLGKVLRINPDGSIPSDNPFYDTASGKNQAIWALGLRNPFRASVQPGTGRIFVNDVGGGRFEEVNNATTSGKNFGWPGIEGFRTTQTPPANYQDPQYAYDRSQGCSITGGTFYNPTTANFPASYQGKYFFSDYCNGYIKTLDFANGNTVVTFATGISRPVDIEVAPDGSLYYLARGGQGGGSVGDNTSSNNGEVWRVYYSGSDAPSISAQPVSKTVSVSSPVTFTVSATGTALNYQWQRNGANISGATSASYTISAVTTSDNTASFRVVVSNAQGSVTSSAATLTVTSNQAPTATIVTPTSGTLFSAGETIEFSGTGTDPEDGTLPASAFSWRVDLHHDVHTHPALDPTSGSKSGSFTISTNNEIDDNIWYRIYLTVTDDNGQSHTTYREIFPRKVEVTLTTNPAGLQVNLDGQTVTTPYTFTGVVGITRNLEAVTPQTSGGLSYQFSSWSDGGNLNHNIATPTADGTYTATFTQALRTPENPASTVSGVEYQYYECSWNSLPDFTALTPVETGNVASFDLSPRNRNEQFGFRFSGYVNVPTDGEYTFYTGSDDGSELFIGNKLVVANGGLHSYEEKSGKIGLKAGKHAISVTFFERGGDELLDVSYVGPGISKQAIPATALFRADSGFTSLVLEAEDAVKSGVQVSNIHAGYSGTGFADYANATDDYLEWTANVPSAGTYTLAFRYALGNGGDRPLQIQVNGNVTETELAFPNTSTWTNWQTVSLTANLQAGNNTIRATATGASGANLDYLEISSGTSASKVAVQPSGVGEPSETMKYYPLPANETLIIESPTELESTVQLTTLQGVPVAPVYAKPQSGRLALNVSGMKPGMYLLTVRTAAGKTVTRKIVVQR